MHCSANQSSHEHGSHGIHDRALSQTCYSCIHTHKHAYASAMLAGILTTYVPRASSGICWLFPQDPTREILCYTQMPVKQGCEILGEEAVLGSKVLKRVISEKCGAGK